jgi:hypothetical protein
MPLIKARPHHVPTVRHVCRLRQPNRNALLQYAQFIGDSPDYVLNQLIATTIAKDREFLAWQAEARQGPASEFVGSLPETVTPTTRHHDGGGDDSSEPHASNAGPNHDRLTGDAPRPVGRHS